MAKNFDFVPGNLLPTALQQQALNIYVHRFTGDHVPPWSRHAAPNGKHYAPGYANDAEWLENTSFPVVHKKTGLDLARGRDVHCNSINQSWPWGQWLDTPFVRGMPALTRVDPEASPSTLA